MAVATALAAVEGGCEVVNVGVNGYGEGAGHVSLADTVYHLEFLYGFDTGIRLEKLRAASVFIADIMRQPLPKATPLVGDDAFVFRHDKHHMFPNHPFIFKAIKPEVVGNRDRPGFRGMAGTLRPEDLRDSTRPDHSRRPGPAHAGCAAGGIAVAKTCAHG